MCGYVEYDYEIEPEPTYRHELEHDHAPTEPNLLEFSSHLRCRHCIRSKGVLPDGDDSNLDEIRKNLLWGNLMAGGWGVQYLFGTSFSESDLILQDFEQSRYARFLWRDTVLGARSGRWRPRMNGLVSELQIPCSLRATTRSLSFTRVRTDNTYTVWWFDPRKGGQMKGGRPLMVKSGSNVSLGEVPYSPDDDWVADN